jgi:hypothetical protein
VIDEIDMPRWYWIGLASGWVGLGVVTDFDRPMVTLIATLAFGAIHAAVYQQVAGGRRRTAGASIRADVAGRRTPVIIGLCLIGLAMLTIAAAVAASADGAQHPVTSASILVAILILLGGPRVMRAIRDHAHRAAAPL